MNATTSPVIDKNEEVDLLKIVAKLSLGEYERQRKPFTQEKINLLDAAIELERELKALLDDKEGDLLIKYSDACTALAAYQSDEHYIAGFIQGYKLHEKMIREKEKVSSLEAKCPSCQEDMTTQVTFKPESDPEPKLVHTCGNCLHAFSRDLSDKEFKDFIQKKKPTRGNESTFENL